MLKIIEQEIVELFKKVGIKSDFNFSRPPKSEMGDLAFPCFELAKKVVNDAGGKLISVYGLVGKYDLMTVMEMPNEKVAAATILKICSTGRITSQSMVAISLDDFIKITREV